MLCQLLVVYIEAWLKTDSIETVVDVDLNCIYIFFDGNQLTDFRCLLARNMKYTNFLLIDEGHNSTKGKTLC